MGSSIVDDCINFSHLLLHPFQEGRLEMLEFDLVKRWYPERSVPVTIERILTALLLAGDYSEGSN